MLAMAACAALGLVGRKAMIAQKAQ